MGHSYIKNYLHIVFSTKKRIPVLDPRTSKRLYRYIGGICKGSDSFPIRIGGHNDHIHILCRLSLSTTVAHLVMHVKKESSKWLKTQGAQFAAFEWQNGYAAFSVSHYALPGVKRYIEKQHIHHLRKSYDQEFRDFCKHYDIDQDEEYLSE